MELLSVAKDARLGRHRQRSTTYEPRSNQSEIAKCAIILLGD